MPKYSVSYSIGSDNFAYEVEGNLVTPQNTCLIAHDDDLTKNCAWHREGYTTVSAWGPEVTATLNNAVRDLIAWTAMETCHREFNAGLDQYHTALSDSEHLAVVDKLRQLPLMADKVLPVAVLDEGVSRVLKAPVSCYNPRLQRFGCSLRIVRPSRRDNNPLHKDVWLDRLRHAINLYIPVAGSNAQSSLSLIPGSHLWNETEISRTEDNCLVNGVTFTVPSVVSSVHGLRMVRPELKGNEIMVFSPYLIHGGARNLNRDITRISLEMRFWRKA